MVKITVGRFHTKKQAAIIAKIDIQEQELKKAAAKAGDRAVSVDGETYGKNRVFPAFRG